MTKDERINELNDELVKARERIMELEAQARKMREFAGNILGVGKV